MNLLYFAQTFLNLSVNIQGINAKFDKFLAPKTYVNENNFMLSAICMQISWLKQGQDISLFQIPGYDVINQPKVCSEHGGLINYFLKLGRSFYIYIYIYIFRENTNKKIIIGNIYRKKYQFS